MDENGSTLSGSGFPVEPPAGFEPAPRERTQITTSALPLGDGGMMSPPWRRFAIDSFFRIQPGSPQRSSRSPPWPSSVHIRAAPAWNRGCCALHPSRRCGTGCGRGKRPGRTFQTASGSCLRRCVNDGDLTCQGSRFFRTASSSFFILLRRGSAFVYHVSLFKHPATLAALVTGDPHFLVLAFFCRDVINKYHSATSQSSARMSACRGIHGTLRIRPRSVYSL